MTDPLVFLRSVFDGDRPVAPSTSRPYVTLTFAQSLDAKIAGAGGKQLILSGKESMIMTHWLRTMHDGVLIGIGTALNDDPQLNTRHLGDDGAGKEKPRPIVLDTNLRLPVECKLMKNYREGKGRRPWVLCSKEWGGSARKQRLEEAGARVIMVDGDEARGLDVARTLATLRESGIETVMVEGGAKIIETMMDKSDILVLTTAPVFVGVAGTGYRSTSGFKLVETAQIGRDSVVALRRE